MLCLKRLFLFLYIAASFHLAAHTTSLLIKIPTRSRPHQFFKTLDAYYQHLSLTIPYTFLITCDEDDASMNNPTIIQRLRNYPNLVFNFHPNTSKVEAYNKDIDAFDFDIVIAASDDMVPLAYDFDVTILKTMQEHFPHFDGVLNPYDGTIGRQCNTLPIIGKNFYKQCGYIYHPAYKALVCNVELTYVSKILKKEKVIDEVLIKHNHPAWGLTPMDALYTKNETYHGKDKETFSERRARFFDLSQTAIDHATPKLWSILICTMEEREHSFTTLYNKLQQQILALNAEQYIEVLYYKDKRGEHSIGAKRNALLEQSSGKYISFIDDDDDIHERYVPMIYEKLLKNPDCVSLTGIITFDGENPHTFIHSINHIHYFEYNNIYYRPPNHLNPIRRSIACQFTFPDNNFEEDNDWAMAIARSQLLRTEERIDDPYYFYLYKTNG